MRKDIKLILISLAVILLIVAGCKQIPEQKIEIVGKEIQTESEQKTTQTEAKTTDSVPKAFGHEYWKPPKKRTITPGKIKVMWLGHGTVLLESVNGKRIIIDPWLEANPSTPPKYKDISAFGNIDMVLLTHGHVDHFTLDEIKAISEMYEPEIVAQWELGLFLQDKIATPITLVNKDGKIIRDNIIITQVYASHSSSVKYGTENVYTGTGVGYIIDFENGFKVYFAGDTGLSSDMKFIIGDYYKPDLTFLPIGDIFGLDGKKAAFAASLINPKYVIPEHYGSYPILAQTPDEFLEAMKKYPEITTIVLKPGEEIEI